MICKKCGIAVADNAAKCPKCGRRMPRFTHRSTWVAVLALLMVCAGAALRVATDNPAQSETENPMSTAPQTSEQPDSGGDVLALPTSALPPLSEYTSKPGASKTIAENIVFGTAAAARVYYEKYHDTNEFAAYGGMFYEVPARANVTTMMLYGTPGFDSSFATENVIILYVDPADVPSGIVEVGDATPSIYAAYPYEDEFVIASSVDCAWVSRDEMAGLLLKYSADNGPIYRISRGDALYYTTLSALINNANPNGFGAPLDVRYMCADDKYISVVASPTQNPLDIREFLLKKNGDEVDIIIDNIENSWQKYADITAIVPDFNISLIPEYSLARDLKDVKSDFLAILDSIRGSGILSEQDGEPEFISGNSEFVFIEFATDKNLLLHNDGSQLEWKVYLVKTYDEAITRMKEIARVSVPPYFLIRQG
ncbi:MAG: zinc ribbon domain-containing protein [Clostridiales bacterium]|nr:zinc ribbon domain-containing protein [Clostridiales bacterium]